LEGEAGAYNISKMHMNFILRITPEEFSKGKKESKKSLREK